MSRPPDPAAVAGWPAELYLWRLSAYKRRVAAGFFPGIRLLTAGDAARVPAGATLALWGSTPRPEGLSSAVRVVRVEDGFLRSVGLGADLVRPQSWVVDRVGIYYDARAPSELEGLLGRGVDDPALLQRARALREAIVSSGITKYNVGAGAWQRPAGARRVVLAVGQVESDASIAHGGSAVRSDAALLEAVRRQEPDAHIVYKPHPDVLAGLRSAGREVPRPACDELVTDCAIGPLLEAVDAVHVMTSLAGFEALLRGTPVVTHGMPFYAGWGLSDDRALSAEVAARRPRRLTLDELVAAALIAYPRYVSRETGLPTTPEVVLAELEAQQARGAAMLPWWRRAARPVLGLAARWRGQ